MSKDDESGDQFISRVFSKGPFDPVPTREEWVTFGRIKVDMENETEIFERINPESQRQADYPERGHEHDGGRVFLFGDDERQADSVDLEAIEARLSNKPVSVINTEADAWLLLAEVRRLTVEREHFQSAYKQSVLRSELQLMPTIERLEAEVVNISGLSVKMQKERNAALEQLAALTAERDALQGERDVLARGFEVAIAVRNQATPRQQSLYMVNDWTAITEALALTQPPADSVKEKG